jgi:hypothetical protein
VNVEAFEQEGNILVEKCNKLVRYERLEKRGGKR